MLDVPVRLNVNENPYPPSPALVRALAEAVASVAGTLNRYPDRDAIALRGDLAGYLGHGLTAAQVWAANGSNEIIQQLLQVFGGPGRSALGFEPSYSMHPLITRITNTRWIPAAREEDFGLDPDRAVAVVSDLQPDVVFLTSPNNPTGTRLPLAVIAAVCAVAPGMVVVTRTMSKAFALAGARIGYLAASPAVVQALQIVRLPYHLSAVTQTVARVALRHASELLATVAVLRSERDALVDWLRQRGLAAADSDANFVLFGKFGDRHAVWQGLLDRGVLIRETGPRGWLRVSIGTAAEMDTFRTALDEVLAS
jgi:histidinol-phosphate aminotransferase